MVAAAVEAADRSGAVHFVTHAFGLESCNPLALYDDAAGDDRFYWCRGAARVAMSSRGAAAVVEAKGDGRFDEVQRGLADVVSRLHTAEGGGKAALPVFVGGFAFSGDAGSGSTWSGFPPARFVLPAVLVRRDASGAVAIVSQRVAPGESASDATALFDAALRDAADHSGKAWRRAPVVHPDPPTHRDAWEAGAEYAVVGDRPHDVYRGQVAAALRAIEAGGLEKVVLARALDVRHPGQFDVSGFLATLGRIYPHCTVLAVGRGADTLVAATPELLVRHDGERVEACAVAGSAPRGRTPDEDDALGRALAESAKEQAEHQAVVRAIRAALAEPCASLSGPDRPELMRVEGIQHLATPLSGRLRDDVARPSVLDLVHRMHPTPAVGGLPDAAARNWIARHEGLDRGWYAGPVGFVDAAGCGELWVALRSALVRNAADGADEGAPHRVAARRRGGAAAALGTPVSVARLFAGAGIVAGSEPEAELRETRLKLRALLAPLTEI